MQEIVQKRNKAEAVAPESDEKRETWKRLKKHAERTISTAKKNHWRKPVNDKLNPSPASGKVFNVIRFLDGGSHSRLHKALKFSDKIITTREGKAKTLLNTYPQNCRPDVKTAEEKLANLKTKR